MLAMLSARTSASATFLGAFIGIKKPRHPYLEIYFRVQRLPKAGRKLMATSLEHCLKELRKHTADKTDAPLRTTPLTDA